MGQSREFVVFLTFEVEGVLRHAFLDPDLSGCELICGQISSVNVWMQGFQDFKELGFCTSIVQVYSFHGVAAALGHMHRLQYSRYSRIYLYVKSEIFFSSLRGT